jgi:ABC-2 type transport system ATP-binding protein
MLVAVEGLTKSFGSRRAVDGLSFEIERGSVVGFLGPNGAGKSTTFRLLSGALVPDAGAARIAGYDVVRQPEQARSHLGYLPDAATGFSHLTVHEFLCFCAEARGLWGVARRSAIERVAHTVELGSGLGLRMAVLSRGWRQRAWLAQALLADPAVLVLDEPTDGLDPNQKLRLHSAVRSAAANKAVLLSTHILEEAEAVCDRIIVLLRGQVVADGPCHEFLDANGRLLGAYDRLTREAELAGASSS